MSLLITIILPILTQYGLSLEYKANIRVSITTWLYDSQLMVLYYQGGMLTVN